MGIPTIEFLTRRRVAVLADLRLKVDAEDFHGVADCAMDLREIDAMLKVLMLESPEVPRIVVQHA
jgi:hypothetical protein